MVEASHLAILGFGEAARTLATGLQGRGPAEVRVWKRKPWTDEVERCGGEAGVILCGEAAEAVAGCEVVFSLVSPDAAVDVAEKAAPHCAGKTYVDLNATTLRAMEAAGEALSRAGGNFVDGAIMGPLGRQKHRVSTVVSGMAAEDLAGILQSWDMDVRAIGTRVGLASTVKMVRSVYTKGLEAIVLEFMRAAQKYGATELVLESLEEILRLGPFLRPFREMVDELVTEQVDHAPRRAAEMEQVVKTMEELGVDSRMARGTLETLSRVAELGLREKLGDKEATPESILGALNAG